MVIRLKNGGSKNIGLRTGENTASIGKATDQGFRADQSTGRWNQNNMGSLMQIERVTHGRDRGVRGGGRAGRGWGQRTD